MLRSLAAGIALLVCGTAIVALPDDGRRVVSLSQEHGPSLVDSLGVVVLLAGWLVIAAAVVRRRARVLRRAGTAGTAAGLAVAACGAAILASSIVGDHGAWWLVGAALAALPQIVAVVLAR